LVRQLAAHLKNEDLHQFFSQAGKVNEAQIIMDKISKRSKGVSFSLHFKKKKKKKKIKKKSVVFLKNKNNGTSWVPDY